MGPPNPALLREPLNTQRLRRWGRVKTMDITEAALDCSDAAEVETQTSGDVDARSSNSEADADFGEDSGDSSGTEGIAAGPEGWDSEQVAKWLAEAEQGKFARPAERSADVGLTRTGI